MAARLLCQLSSLPGKQLSELCKWSYVISKRCVSQKNGDYLDMDKGRGWYRPRRAVMYVPASDERKYNKIPSLGADTVVLDCEDGVAVNKKVCVYVRVCVCSQACPFTLHEGSGKRRIS